MGSSSQADQFRNSRSFHPAVRTRGGLRAGARVRMLVRMHVAGRAPRAAPRARLARDSRRRRARVHPPSVRRPSFGAVVTHVPSLARDNARHTLNDSATGPWHHGHQRAQACCSAAAPLWSRRHARSHGDDHERHQLRLGTRPEHAGPSGAVPLQTTMRLQYE